MPARGEQVELQTLGRVHGAAPADLPRTPLPGRHPRPHLHDSVGIHLLDLALRLAPLAGQVRLALGLGVEVPVGLGGLDLLLDLLDVRCHQGVVHPRRLHLEVAPEAARSTVVPGLLDLGVQGPSHLLGRVREEDDDQADHADRQPRQRAAPDPACRVERRPQHAEQCDRPQHGEPRRLGGVVLAVHQHHRRACDQGPGPAEEAPHAQRHEQQQEQLEEGPRGQPRAGHLVRARGPEQLPAGRQMEHHRELLDIVVPADGGQRGPCVLHPDLRLESQRRLTQLHAGSPGLGVGRDEQGLSASARRNAAQLADLAVVEPPPLMQLAQQPILDGVPDAVEVEPGGPHEADPVGRWLRLADAQRAERQPLARLGQERRRAVPVLGQRGPARVDGHQALQVHRAHEGSWLPDPDLLGIEDPAGEGGHIDAVGRRRQHRVYGDLVGARPHVDAQHSLGIESSR